MLIDRLEDIRLYFNLSVNDSESAFHPSIRSATEQFITPFLGEEFQTEVEAIYAKHSWSDSEKKLLSAVHRPLVNFAVLHFMDTNEISVESTGIYRHEDENQKSAYGNQIRRLKVRLYNEAYRGLDYLLRFLETEKNNYTTWKENVWISQRQYFVKTAEAFGSHLTTRQPYSIFYAVRHLIKRVQENQVKQILGDELYNLVLQNLNEDKTDFQWILDICCPLIVHHTMALAINELVISVTPIGLLAYASTDTEDEFNRESASFQLRKDYLNHQKNYAAGAEKALISECNTRANDGELEAFKTSSYFLEESQTNVTDEDLDQIPGWIA